jgi:hypothetical protein
MQKTTSQNKHNKKNQPEAKEKQREKTEPKRLDDWFLVHVLQQEKDR